MDFSQGFVPGSRGTLMIDAIAIAMAVLVPFLTWALALARWQGDFQKHKKVQIGISSGLGLIIVLFEIDVRLHDWVELARPSPYFATLLFPVFYGHLFCAISATILWSLTLTTALRRFSKPPRPNSFSAIHKQLGYATAFFMYTTALTGTLFFYLAFVAR